MIYRIHPGISFGTYHHHVNEGLESDGRRRIRYTLSEGLAIFYFKGTRNGSCEANPMGKIKSLIGRQGELGDR
jgi:hypothetical protein